MSTIRFIHTDYLRLAHSMQGITSAPGWLQEALTDATRRATRQIIETAISESVDFLLIAGSLTDVAADVPIATAWLDEQLAVARRAGIQIAAVSDNEQEAHGLRQICDVVVDRHHYLLADRTSSGDVRLTNSSTQPARHDGLSISFNDRQIHAEGLSCHYDVMCGPAAGVASRDSHGEPFVSRATAGAIQAEAPQEQWVGGCLLVSADLHSRRIQTTSIAVSSIRYLTNQLTIDGRTTVGRLVEEIAMASRNLQRGQSETVLVDWVISAAIDASHHEVGRLEEDCLLASLRTDLHSGHQGVWPRSIRFADESTLQVSTNGDDAVKLLEDVAGEGRYSTGRAKAITSELLCSLAALQEAA